jgi:hypothetical protein
MQTRQMTKFCPIWHRCYDLKKIAEKFGENLAFFAKTTVCFCKNLIITLVFEKNAILTIGKNR